MPATTTQIESLDTFKVGKRYVFFQSLLEKEGSPLYKIGNEAKDLLEAEGRNILLNMNPTTPTGIEDIVSGIKFLQQAAEYERKQEQRLFDSIQSQLPDDEKKNLNTDNYYAYIKRINEIIKGKKIFDRELSAEINRRKSSIRSKMPSNIQQKLKQRSQFHLTLPGEEVYTSLLKENDFSRQLNSVLERYGDKLFKVDSNGNFILDGTQTATIIKVIIEYLYSLEYIYMLNSVNNEFSDTEKFTELDKYVEDLLSYDDSSWLDNISQQYGIDSATIKKLEIVNGEEMDALRQKIERYIPEKASQEKIQEQMEKMVRSIHAVNSQLYYTSEDRSIIEFIRNGISASLGGSKVNPTDDFQAGKLICSVSVDSSAMKTLEQKLTNLQKTAFSNLVSTGSFSDFKQNTDRLLRLREEQITLLKQQQQKNNEQNNTIEELLSHINIHGTVKAYFNRGHFEGAGFGGGRLTEQLNTIQYMAETGGITIADIETLKWLAINAGSQMIGNFNKDPLTKYFSIFAGFLMFNDAALMMKDAVKYIQDQFYNPGLSSEVHLYNLNGILVPSSYILSQTAESLNLIWNEQKETYQFENNNKSIKIKLNTYNGLIRLKYWEQVEKYVTNQTSLSIVFLGGFLDLLNKIQGAIS